MQVTSEGLLMAAWRFIVSLFCLEYKKWFKPKVFTLCKQIREAVQGSFRPTLWKTSRDQIGSARFSNNSARHCMRWILMALHSRKTTPINMCLKQELPMSSSKILQVLFVWLTVNSSLSKKGYHHRSADRQLLALSRSETEMVIIIVHLTDN